jgi:hypothetical protein
VTVAERLGHADPSIAASTYAHGFKRIQAGGQNEPGSYAAAIEAGLGRVAKRVTKPVTREGSG